MSRKQTKDRCIYVPDDAICQSKSCEPGSFKWWLNYSDNQFMWKGIFESICAIDGISARLTNARSDEFPLIIKLYDLQMSLMDAAQHYVSVLGGRRREVEAEISRLNGERKRLDVALERWDGQLNRILGVDQELEEVDDEDEA